ncbi:MAG: hypothetical protein IT328_10030 [Caldilineaceae bacterium]|nr:hypothetical protein [Caldilineaceae bacterium]
MDEMDKAYAWPYVLKPRWVHDLLLLWRRKQPYDLYIDQVTDYSVAEMRDESLRRCCVAWMANHFAPSRSASTLAQNVWASYSNHFRANDLAPAYLAYLALREPLARQTIEALDGHFSPGMSIRRALLSNVNAAPGAIESLLRTLQHWGVLADNPRQGGYVGDSRLCVAPAIFPLLVWSWWLDARQPSIALEEFRQMPLWTWLETGDFAQAWQCYAGRLWTLDAEGGVPTVYFLPADPAGFTRALLNLLSIDGRSGRQFPRRGDDEDAGARGVAAAPVALGR